MKTMRSSKACFKKNNTGYSLIVLVISIVVILILAGVSISSLQTSREKTEIMNFMFDINAIQDKVQNYYVETGTLPTKNTESIDIYDFANQLDYPESFLSQLSDYDNENYYFVDLAQLKGLTLRKPNRSIPALHVVNPYDNGYIVNEGSLKVYVENGVPYKKDGEKVATTYYTITSSLASGQEKYVSLEEDLVIIGNPQVWVKQAELRVVLPKRSLQETDWDRDWTFKWDFGPKTEEELDSIPKSSAKNNFKYGEKLVVKSNGIYSIFVKDPNGNKTVRNVNITKIDDIAPNYVFTDGGTRLSTFDNETGIRHVKFKKLSEYKENYAQAQKEAQTGGDANSEARTKVDYYLMDGMGQDVIYEFNTLIEEYINQKKKIELAIEEENGDYERWTLEHPVDGVVVLQKEADDMYVRHSSLITDYNRQMLELKQKYSYLDDLQGSTDESRLVLYIEDDAGNGNVVGDEDFISTSILADSFNIDLSKLSNET